MCVLEFRLVIKAAKGRTLIYRLLFNIRIMLLYSLICTTQKKKNYQQKLYSLYQFPLTQPMDENKIHSICVCVVYYCYYYYYYHRIVDESNGYKMVLSYGIVCLQFVKLNNEQRATTTITSNYGCSAFEYNAEYKWFGFHWCM